MANSILVTGGTGKTGSRVVGQLKAKGVSPRVGTRSPKGENDARFDWKDPSTFDAAFKGVRAVYLIAPTDTVDSLGGMQPGLEAALAAGVQRFVLLSGSSLEEGGPMMGAVHAWLRSNALEWAVLRPAWFMQNFSELHHRDPIRDEAAIYTATDDGRIGFIDAGDIAACAAALLVADTVENTDYILTGPEAISYDVVAETLTNQLGRQISHNRLTIDGLAERHQGLGLPEEYARSLAAMDGAIAAGSEDRVTGNVQKLTGKVPTSIAEFVQQNLEAWTQRKHVKMRVVETANM
ncbi:ergot alkaloid biosynthesis protein [Ruegeria sp. 2205SS24-7]|uniref:ergot alkaloid biosynthesis protein n=1 Tax=Ruegeria discodermiae TaxID=3064389 RepID=UPI002742535B|nr:ergot alkaloid biosynthesis protein [Ruegeria sp. 2205SS24-7]MDP5220560.1 ergot alkaloid biosynthesis protein [Ruegeria sp. 2205SS24-7]